METEDCRLIEYSTSFIKGYNGLTVRIDPDFKPLMDEMDGQIRKCGVTMHITHAFRKDGQDLDGTVYPPATRSNHLVGHAIDMNLDTPRGWCNSTCLAAEGNTYAKEGIKHCRD